MTGLNTVTRATREDISELVRLVNSAYRGNAARQGWTHEADLISGELRTDEHDLEALMNDPDAVILKFQDNDHLSGCVYLQKQKDILYLGMLSVNPAEQAKGIGKQLLQAAERHAVQSGCTSIEMSVITQRKELIEWYQRNGYRDSGRTRPFHTEKKFGIPNEPVEFMVMEKTLAS